MDIQVEKISIGHSDINICRGCRVCFDIDEDRCPLKDDVLNIRDKMIQADGYVIASPVYVEGINGIMKNWIDRMAFNSHRSAFFGKSVYLLTTSGIGSSNHSFKIMSTAVGTWAMNVTGKMNFRLDALTEMQEIRIKYGEKINKVAKKFSV